MSKNAFETFAPRILQSYHRNPNAFWEASLAPFLNRSPLITLLKHSRLSIEMLQCFKNVHQEAKSCLFRYGEPQGLNIWDWKSLQSKEEYFTDAYPIYAFLVIWLSENKLIDIIHRFGAILEAVVYGIAGYGILDVLVDSNQMHAVQLLEAQRLINAYENVILNVYGYNETNYAILHQIRDRFYEAEIKEKNSRFIQSPYAWDNPMQCGYKAIHLLTPFMLALKQLNREHQIDLYFKVFFQFGAVIQIIDDYKDLEEDLAIGHYAYMCLETEIAQKMASTKNQAELIHFIRSNKTSNMKVYRQCKQLIEESKMTLMELNDAFLMRIVEITEHRMNQYFTQDLSLNLE